MSFQGARNGEIAFIPLETKKTNYFAVNRKMSKSRRRPSPRCTHSGAHGCSLVQ